METFLVNLVANLVGRVRRQTLNGREYLVAPVSMIVPGVLEGSRGALYYPDEEVSRNVDAWNGMPLTARHPVIDGVPVGARTPRVYDKFHIGYVFTANYDGRDGRLVAEAWFDIDLTRRIDNRIIGYLEAGKQIEVSTGLFTQNQPAPEGANFKGRPYTQVARNYRPDHLAVLVDDIGACSVRDGCGLNVNASLNPVENSVNKDQLIAWLTANCACWKGPSASAALNTMTEPELNQLKTSAEQSVALNSQLTAGIIVNGAKVVLADGKLSATQISAAPAPAATPVSALDLTPIGNNTQGSKPASMKDWLATNGSPQEKAVWNTMTSDYEQQRQNIITKLTANISDAGKKAAAQATYSGLDLDALKAIAPPEAINANNTPTNGPNFALGAGGPLQNQNGPLNLTVNKVDNKPVTKMVFENPLAKKAS